MATTTQQLTLQDFLKLPNIEESPAWEFVDGQANQKPMPTAHALLDVNCLDREIDDAWNAMLLGIGGELQIQCQSGYTHYAA